MRLRLLGVMVAVCLWGSPGAFCQEPAPDEANDALVAMQHEDFEEAALLLQSLRGRYPESAQIAYYLGVAYKRLQNYAAAEPHLRAAAGAEPPVAEAFPELIDVLFQRDELDQARRWIEESRKRGYVSAQTLFLKGLVLLRGGTEPHAAIEAFEEAVWFDPSYAQASKYQIALARAQAKDYSQAEAFLREIIVQDPAADLASYASDYIDVLELQRRAARPFHGSFAYALQYDDNVVAVPTDDLLAASSNEKDDWKHFFSAQGDYTIKPGDAVSLKAGYALQGIKHDSIGFYDTESFGVPLQLAFQSERMVIAFPAQYTYSTVNDSRYLETWSMGTLDNFLVGRSDMLQLQAQYTLAKYRWSPTVHDDKKSGREYVTAAGWYHFLGSDRAGFWGLRYALEYDDTCGQNWRALGSRFTFSLVVPVVERVKWNCVTDYVRNKFLKEHSSYRQDRIDGVATVSNLLSYQIARDTDLQFQHTYTYSGSTIGVYQYKKNVYSAGIKYRF